MNVRFSVLTLLTASLSPFLSAQQIQVNKENKTIAITASDQADALADTAVLTVGFHLYGKDQDSTYADASRTSNAIISALTQDGVPKDVIQSVSQSLNPLEQNNDSDRARYTQGMRFEFSQSWHVTAPAAAAANVLHIAIISGANDSGDIQWQLSHDDALEADAAGKALAHAKQIASRMAAALGAKLGALVYASNQSPPRGLAALLGGNGMALNTESASVAMAKRNLAPLAISPERITRSATVYAVFAIE